MSDRPAELKAGSPESAEAKATQLTLLLAAVTSIVDEEFRRSERLDAKSRNQLTVAGAFFAAVQAVAVALINGALGANSDHNRSPFVVWLAISGAAAAVALVGAAYVSYRSWKLRDDPAIGVNTGTMFLSYALDGNPAVGAKLIKGYETVAIGRRKNNDDRADALEKAAVACGVVALFLGIELVLAFVAVAVR